MNIEAMLEREEGRVYTAYPDPLTRNAPWTIGIGHTGPEVHDGLVWNDDQINDAFQLDVASATQVCFDHFEPWFDTLNDARQAVLIAMAFQMGPTRLLKFVDTIAAIRDGHFAHAAECMRQSIWAHQTPLRALRMASQIETGEWQ